MPSGLPTAEQLWEGQVTFFCLDTDVIQATGFNFTSGALHQLPKQLPPTMRLLMTEVVCREIAKHRMKSVHDALARFKSACDEVRRVTGAELQKVEKLIKPAYIADQSSRTFGRELESFVVACRGEALGIAGQDAALDLFNAYFDEASPFENKKDKKSEFPDAMSLWLLERHAIANDTLGIVVSGDNGWGNYANSSARLYRVESVDALTSLFAATDEHSAKITALLIELAQDPSSVLSERLEEELECLVESAEWDTSDVFSASFRVESEIEEARLRDFSIHGEPKAWPGGDPKEWIVELKVSLTVDVNICSEFFVWDSIDREELSLGIDSCITEEVLEIDVFLNCAEVRLGTSAAEWAIDLDFSSGKFSVSAIEVEPDFR